jgi:predicted nucleic acid-binding Zn ribbon protein
MPAHDYFCEPSGRMVEVSHRMAEQPGTRGQLCSRAGIGAGTTALGTPVRKLISGAACRADH